MAPSADASPTCSIRWLEPLLTTLRRLGVQAGPLLAAEGLGPDHLADLDLRIPTAKAAAVWRAAYEAADDPALGVRVVETMEAEPFSLGTYLSATSRSAREAFERGIRFSRIAHGGLRCELTVEGGRSICRVDFAGSDPVHSEREFTLGMMVRLAPLIAGGKTGDREVWLRHEAIGYEPLAEAVFGCSVRFEAPYDALIGDAKGLDRPLPRADSALCRLLEEHAAALLARAPRPGFADRVRECVVAQLRRGNASADHVASALGTSPRTLRRRLREAGLTYQRVLDEVRCDLAKKALAEDGLSVNEVAFLLGFSDASAFHKAFRRWTGRGPGEYAAAMRTATGSGRASL